MPSSWIRWDTRDYVEQKGGWVIGLICASLGMTFIYGRGRRSLLLTAITFLNIAILYAAFRIIDAQNRRSRAVNCQLDKARSRLDSQVGQKAGNKSLQ